MSDTSPFGFGRFVPGFDFLQKLSEGAAAGTPTMPPLASWVAPTMSVEEIDQRIRELKRVQFWLEQNARALTATVQALEVQRMTLATLQGMNVAMKDMASGAFQAPPEPKTEKAQATGDAAKDKPREAPPRPWPIRCSGGARSPSSFSRSRARPWAMRARRRRRSRRRAR